MTYPVNVGTPEKVFLEIILESAILPSDSYETLIFVVGSHANDAREPGQTGNRAAISVAVVVPWQTRPPFFDRVSWPIQF